jgi:ABC-type multidrug transport system ATPase subunit
MIVVERLTKSFGRFRAVDDVSLRVHRGEAVALWGANGAGKTSIIRCLLGLLRYRGRITVVGLDMRRQGKAARRAIGYVPQELALYDDLRVTEALHFFARLKRAASERVREVLDDVGIADHAGKRVRALSGGMKQRMALAVALLNDPPLLVLDELTANLDAAAQAGFLGLLQQQKREGKTILFTSHHLSEVDALADRVLVMESGRITHECAAGALATVLGLRCRMLIAIEPGRRERAATVLEASGYATTPNGHGLRVEVSPGDKAGPIQALARADIPVDDFEVSDAADGEPMGGVHDDG